MSMNSHQGNQGNHFIMRLLCYCLSCLNLNRNIRYCVAKDLMRMGLVICSHLFGRWSNRNSFLITCLLLYGLFAPDLRCLLFEISFDVLAKFNFAFIYGSFLCALCKVSLRPFLICFLYPLFLVFISKLILVKFPN